MVKSEKFDVSFFGESLYESDIESFLQWIFKHKNGAVYELAKDLIRCFCDIKEDVNNIRCKRQIKIKKDYVIDMFIAFESNNKNCVLCLENKVSKHYNNNFKKYIIETHSLYSDTKEDFYFICFSPFDVFNENKILCNENNEKFIIKSHSPIRIIGEYSAESAFINDFYQRFIISNNDSSFFDNVRKKVFYSFDGSYAFKGCRINGCDSIIFFSEEEYEFSIVFLSKTDNSYYLKFEKIDYIKRTNLYNKLGPIKNVKKPRTRFVYQEIPTIKTINDLKMIVDNILKLIHE